MHPSVDIDDPKSSSTMYVGIIGFIALIISIYIVHALYYAVDNRLRAESAKPVPFEVEIVRTTTLRKLTTYRTVDSAQKLYAIPIEEAMILEAERLAKEQ